MSEATQTPTQTRRNMIGRASTWMMRIGLLGGYGAFAMIAARFLYPAREQRRQWMFVTEQKDLTVGASLLFRGPSGETVNIARKDRNGTVDDFIALSSTCPHLGCQVHWESQHGRFFCPCHNGTFDPSGRGTGGPPGDAKLSLPRYPLRLDHGLLYIELPVESLTASRKGQVIDRVAGIHGPGHDPCLKPRTPSLDTDNGVA